MSARDGGFVLVNALVLVAALAGIATLLLARAEAARLRAQAGQEAAQTALYLDAFETLALHVLERDRAGGPLDHAGEAWAGDLGTLALDRGQVAGRITDLQSLFNVNWLADPEDAAALAGFAALLTRAGLAPGLADAVTDMLAPEGPADPAPFARADPALAPPGGPVALVGQLLAVPGFDARARDRLVPWLAALPPDSALNVNTAPAEVLRAMLPGLGAAQADRLVRLRRAAPFDGADAFARALETVGGPDLPEDARPRFGVASTWFAADITATLGDRQVRRRTIIERPPLPARARVAYRLTDPP